MLSHQTAAQWREATFGSFLAEDYWRSTRERSMNGVVTRIRESSVVPFQLPLGFIRNEDGSGRIDPKLRPVVRKCFAIRAGGATIREVRAFLADKGIDRSYRSVQIMLASPLYVGELHLRGDVFKIVKPMVDRHVSDTMRRMRVPAGRPPSPSSCSRARACCAAPAAAVGIVTSGAWAKHTTAASKTRRTRYAFYKCGRGAAQDCHQPVSIRRRSWTPTSSSTSRRFSPTSRAPPHGHRGRDTAIAAEAARRRSRRSRNGFCCSRRARATAALAVIEKLSRRGRGAAQEGAAGAQRRCEGVEVVKSAGRRPSDDADAEALPAKRGFVELALAEVIVGPGRASVAERVELRAAWLTGGGTSASRIALRLLARQRQQVGHAHPFVLLVGDLIRASHQDSTASAAWTSPLAS